MAKNWKFFLSSFYRKRPTVFSDLLDRKLAILYYKNIDLKKSKVLHFFNVVSPWFLVKKWKFVVLSFSAKQAKRKCFLTFQTENQLFYTIKTSILKSLKFCIFSKCPGQFMVFGQKMEILSFCLFHQNRPKESVF